MTYQNTAKSQGSNVSTPLSLAAYDLRKKPVGNCVIIFVYFVMILSDFQVQG